MPLLIREGIPCTYFVTLPNVLDGQPFAHDLARANTPLPNTALPNTPLPNTPLPNTPEQLRAMAAAGIEIGAHTYTHPDLARIAD
ncbi:MAG: polysaccharide deacetylase family protein, partial [Paracoccaceae bacterium]